MKSTSYMEGCHHLINMEFRTSSHEQHSVEGYYERVCIAIKQQRKMFAETASSQMTKFHLNC